MIKSSMTPKQAVSILNELLGNDRRAIESLFGIRVPCNKKLADHPTAQVFQIAQKYYLIGMLGLLNGLFGSDKDGWGCICMEVRYGKIERFRIVTTKDKSGGGKERKEKE